MEQMQVCLLLLFVCSAFSHQFKTGPGLGQSVQDPELEWARMETIIGEEKTQASATNIKFLRSSGYSTSEAKKVPEYLAVSSSKDQKELFKPEKGARPLPNSVKQMLLGSFSTATATGKASRPKLIEILCHVDRIYVRVLQTLFKTKEAYNDLKLGRCPVNQGDAKHFYFLYKLNGECGFDKQSFVDDIKISNTVFYNPSGPVVRELPFTVSVQCKYPRFFHSFKVGFNPKLQGGTVYKALQPKNSYTLTPQDASGNEISGEKSYILGRPMYFEAKGPSSQSSKDQRIYITKCFMTASKDPNSSPKHVVIDNQGCMIDGKLTDQSKFLNDNSKMVQKFSIGAVIFKDSASVSTESQQLYMHCEIAVGKVTPTASLKACNYDAKTKMWKELYGDDGVCACCKTSCSSKSKASRNLISSHSWKVDLSSKDDDVDLEPLMKIGDTFNMEDPEMAEHRDFLSYWDHDY